MKILDKKLKDIIANSGIYFYEKEIQTEFDIADKLYNLEEMMEKIWRSLPGDAKIAIYGLGFNFDVLFKDIELSTKNVVCMIDKHPKFNTYMDYPVIKIEDLPAYDVDIVLITSLIFRDEMETAVINHAPNCRRICLAGEHLRDFFFSPHTKYSNHVAMNPDDLFNTQALNKSLCLYRETRDHRYLLYAIFSYLSFRDIRNALLAIDEYILSDFPNCNLLSDLKDNLLNLLGEISLKLSQNSNPACLTILTDAMGAYLLTPEYMPFIYAFAEKNILCTDAYTHMGWTTTSLLTIFKQQSFFDNHLHNNSVLSGREPFFTYLSESNIDFHYFASFQRPVLSNIRNYHICASGCANMIWQYLTHAYESNNGAACFLHFAEAHLPHHNLNAFDRSIVTESTDQLPASLAYVDSQIEYLFGLLPDNAKVIFSSDHGRTYPEYLQVRCNIPYIICDRLTHAKTETRLVSHLDTINIILNLLNSKPAFDRIPKRDVVEVNGEFYYSKELLEQLNQNPGHGRAFKCFITKTDKYVILYDGEEKYFLLPDDDTNLIDDPKYADRINWFRANVNAEFPDWSDDNGRYDLTREYMDLNKRIEK